MSPTNPEPQMIHAAEQRTAVLRAEVPLGELRDFFGSAFGTVLAAARAQNAHLAGPPFALYRGMPRETIDVEAGFPITGDFHGPADVEASSLPDVQAYEAMHVGPYETLTRTYEAIQQRIRADGFTPADVMWEYYLSGPADQADPTSWLTRVVWPAA